MLKKLNSKTLLVILIALVSIVIFTQIFDETTGKRTFKETLVEIDTSQVNLILIYPHAERGKEIKLTKTSTVWSVQKDPAFGGAAEADNNYVRNILSLFALLKPLRLAATEKEKWNDYNVNDSLGTRVKMLSGEKILLDIVVGKFSFNQMSRSGISYVRLYNESDVYAVDGFLPMTVNQSFNEWRNKNIFRGNKDDLTKISFSYPDSSFVLKKADDGRWIIEDVDFDSTKIVQFLNEITNMSSSAFADNYSPSSSPAMWLTIEGNNMAAPLTIKAFAADSVNQYIIHSSFNPNAYFSAAKGNLTDRIFKRRQFFLQEKSDTEEVKKTKKLKSG